MAKAAPESPALCPTCGQKMPPELGAVQTLLEQRRRKKGLSKAEIARGVGASEQVIGFLFSGRQGTGHRYRGLKPMGGKEAIVVRVYRYLGISDAEFKRAFVEDQLEEQTQQLDLLLRPRRRGANSCSPNMRRKQGLHVLAVTEKSSLGTVSPVAS